MPQQIELSGNRSIQNMYATDGRKLKTTVKEGEELMDGKYYNANFVFDKQKEMEYILFDEGCIVNDNGNFMYEYHVKDHLGSVRVAFEPSANGTAVVQENAYYPFGGTIDDFSYNESENRYKHTGMEAINDFGLNMLDNNARWRDVSAVPRFYAIDPLCEKYYSISPYAYCGNNPMKFIDPTGMIIKDPNGLYGRHRRDMQRNLDGLQAALEKTTDEATRAAINRVIKEYGKIFKEYEALEASSTTYEIFQTDGKDTRTGMSYDSKSRSVRIQIGVPVNEQNTGLIGHELKHAYQYEKKELSLMVDGTAAGSLYDIKDETAAWNREQLISFGTGFYLEPGIKLTDAEIRKKKDKEGRFPYKDLPKGPININSKKGKALVRRTIPSIVWPKLFPLKEVFKTE